MHGSMRRLLSCLLNAGLTAALLAGCARLERYDAVGAGRLAAATGLGVDTPPGFVNQFAVATPDGTGGPALVPVGPAAGPGGFWILAKGGRGLSEEAMITFYTERMMQHSIEHIRVLCSAPDPSTGPERLDDTFATRNVDGWGGSKKQRFRIRVTWAGSVENEWRLNQEIVLGKSVEDYPAGKVMDYKCRFIDHAVLLKLAAKYGYQANLLPASFD
jgi:hypothetical protein